MRLAPLFLAASAAALLAVNALAQGAAAPAGNQAQPGLSDLSNTVQALEDAPPPTEAPAQPAADPTGIPPGLDDRGARIPAPPLQDVTPVDAAGQPLAPPPRAEPPPAPAAAPSRPPLVMPPLPLGRAQLAELDAAVQRGRLLGLIDRAGRFATQDMLSRISDPNAAGITGWIVEPEGNGVTVTFYADTDAGPVTVYRVTILGGRIVSRNVHLAADRPPLNPLQARMAAARAATAALPQRPCAGEVFNVFVVQPTTATGPIDVYQISPQIQRGHYPLGGHYKTSVAADGSVAASRGYTNACLDAAVADPAAGARPAPVAVTHLMDPLPQDIHVFLSIWTGHPLVVVAGDPQRLFAVTPDRIAEIPR